MLLSLLPLLALAVTTAAAGNRWLELPWRLIFLRVTVFLGAAMVLGTEAASWMGAVTRPVLVLLWSLPIVIGGVWLARCAQRGRLRRLPRPSTPPDLALMAAMIVAATLVAIVAWSAPVQTWDSLTYHMSRVAHWAQNASLRPFATGIERQLYMPPGAEIAFLQAYVLGAGDQLVNLVNWTAWLCAAVAASFVAAGLGARRTAEMASAALVLALPMAVSQASSTMTDLIVGLWLLTCVGELLWMRGKRATLASISAFAISAGLAANTKPTAYVALLPLGIWFVVDRFQGDNWRTAIGATLLAGCMAGLILLAQSTRNLQVYGSLLGPADVAGAFANERRDAPALVSNLLRNAALHAGTPFPALSAGLTGAIDRIHQVLRIDPNDDRTTVFSEWRRVGGMSLSESRTGNTLHLGLLLASLAALLFLRRRTPRAVWLYAGMLLLTLLLYALLFKWQAYGNRLHLPFFMLACPLIAAVLGKIAGSPGVAAVGVGALILAWPWFTRLSSRPLLPTESTQSVVHAPDLEATFYYSPGLAQLYPRLIEPILGRACRRVGIALLGDGAEYPIWGLLGAPDGGLQIEWLVAGTPSARFAEAAFEPCAVICQGCPPEDDQLRGLPVRLRLDAYSLYMAE